METVYLYLDVLFLYNVIINLLLLFLVAYTASFAFSWWRGIVASVVGSFYFCALCTVSYGVPEHFCFQFLVSAFMIFTAFSVREFQSFLKLFFLYYLMNFLLAGGIRFAANFLSDSRISVSLMAVIAGIVFAFVFGPFYVRELRKKRLPPEQTFRLTYNGKTIEFRGFSDTGNMLEEPIEHLSVIVVKKEKLKEIADFSHPETVRNLRLIPCRTVTDGNGMLYGLKPDLLTCEEKTIRAVVAASDSLNQEEYDAVFHPLILL
ncbi:MAG: sigma-E processing peptidase SpoIIGA [Clostridia bacterium]|nr:sigma-E processing peptidase SpoIIGA [Clostridia bacterium]